MKLVLNDFRILLPTNENTTQKPISSYANHDLTCAFHFLNQKGAKTLGDMLRLYLKILLSPHVYPLFFGVLDIEAKCLKRLNIDIDELKVHKIIRTSDQIKRTVFYVELNSPDVLKLLLCKTQNDTPVSIITTNIDGFEEQCLLISDPQQLFRHLENAYT